MDITFFPTPAIIAQIGPIRLHFYGAMYALGAIFGYVIIKLLSKKKKIEWKGEQLLDFVFWTFLGGVLGGRILYVLIYNFSYFLIDHPLKIFAVWEGGMSIHGGLLGGACAAIIFLKKKKLPLWKIAGVVTPAIALGMMLGRLGNFVNGELVGRVTDVPWAMDFGDGETRHPSQLYAAGKDFILFITFVTLNLKTKIPGKKLFALFLIGYGVLRFLVEFFRAPDPQIGLFWNMFSMGQLLSAGVIVIGIFVGYVDTQKMRGETERKP